MGVSPGFQVQMRPSMPVITAWFLLVVILLDLVLSGRLTGVMLVVLLSRYQTCPSESRRRSPVLRDAASTMRMPVFCSTCSGFALPALSGCHFQTCPSVSTMRILPEEATARTACACLCRRVVACSVNFGVGS